MNPNYYEMQREITARVNAELGGSKLRQRSMGDLVKKYRGTLPNGDTVIASVEYGDSCGNGHNTLSITGEVWEKGARIGNKAEHGLISYGCVHEYIEQAIPELAAIIPWHLCSTDGPMHYFANTIYMAGDRDHNGLRKGESRQIRKGGNGPLAWKLEPDKELPCYVDSDTPPQETATLRYVPWCVEGEGKERQLDAARRSAVWPDATDAELMADDLADRLAQRLPDVLRRFHAVVTGLGFEY